MRTTVDLPEPLLRQLKARAALEGVAMKDLVLAFVNAGLSQSATPTRAATRSPLPDLVPNKALAMRRPSNSALMAVLDDADADSRRSNGARGRRAR
jgi:hypothetical protein